MGLKDIMKKLAGKRESEESKPRRHYLEVEMATYQKEEDLQRLDKKVKGYRKMKEKEMYTGERLIDQIDKKGNPSVSRKEVEGSIIKAEAEKVEKEAYFKEQKRLAALEGKAKAKTISKIKLAKLKKKLKISPKKRQVSAERAIALIRGERPKLRSPYYYGEPTGLMSGVPQQSENILDAGSSHVSGNILDAPSIFGGNHIQKKDSHSDNLFFR